MRAPMKLTVMTALLVAMAAGDALARRPRGGGARSRPSGGRNFTPPSRPGGPSIRTPGLPGGGQPTLAPGGALQLQPPANLPGPGGLSGDRFTPGDRPDRTFDDRNPIRHQQWQQQANQIRGQLQNGYNELFTPQWYRDHPYAWQVTHPHADVWAAATFGFVAGWVGAATQPVPYDYGGSVVYQGDIVYFNGEEVATAEEYAQQATDLAEAGQTADEADSEWLPLGVFALVQGKETDAHTVLQLAVSKKGVIRGTYYDVLSAADLPVQGSVDPQTQRVAWTIGNNQATVMEAGLDNLTRDEAPVLVHFGTERTQTWLMVRVKTESRLID